MKIKNNRWTVPKRRRKGVQEQNWADTSNSMGPVKVVKTERGFYSETGTDKVK